MTKQRKTLAWAVAGVLVLVLGTGVYGGFRWQEFKRKHGIVTFDVSGLRLTADSLSLRQIVLIQQPVADERREITVKGLQLEVGTWWQPLPLRSLSIEHLEAQWQQAPGTDVGTVSEDEPLALPDRTQLERWAAWIPRQGRIASLDLALPCASGTCREQGQMKWQHAGEQMLPAEVSMQVQRNTHRLSLLADMYEQGDKTHVDLQLQLDGQQRLTMQNQLTPDSSATRWRGSLAMSELPEAPWLLEWLADWTAYVPPPLPQLPEQMRIGAGWALYIDQNGLKDGWKAMEGELRLSANLPTPWPVAELGQLQGQLDLTAKADRGSWIPTALAADMQLQPAAALVAKLPAQLRPANIHLVVTPGPASESASTLPLNMQLTARGPSPVTLDAQLMLETATAPFAVAFEQTRLSFQSPALLLPDMAMKGLSADVLVNGRASEEAVIVQLGKGSQLKLDRLTSGTEITAENLQLDVAGIGLEAGFTERKLQRLLIDGQVAVEVAKLRQSSLRPQGWRWSGTLKGDRERISLDGPLGNDAGLTLPLTLTHNWTNGAIRLNAKLPELFLRAGNPLAATLADWPPVLELNTGRLQAQGQLEVTADGPPTATATLTAKGLGGIYDRTELSGLDASLGLALQRNQLRLDIQELTLQQANPGFTFGPLRFNGEYLGRLESLDRGRLAWTIAEAQLLGGRLWLDPGAVDLGASKQQLTAHLRGLQLPLLFEAYPTEGLSGTGVVDGELQLLRSEAGISIEQGSLRAREPGGILQFRSAKIQALGQSNPAMRLVTEALDDFHYDLLASDVHYAADGTLNLGLKLHGQNPALEGGRPINFSINLEEDIPALLTSLQLSDRVSETIQRRVQERLR
ncbi:YdbH domain-containing protein [Pseudomonas stutzeri]|uniref:YdbH domain-containing protein n=1 Tax=Stutzerimonas stutzeri TaxID=316 RepID=UPI00210E4BE2|nr:YdbH domain-containing protein [Stutzerimonas stutzeri]MCQ4311927.1 YdbH domain-containing protein [Stutzerimonas stutzeri]